MKVLWFLVALLYIYLFIAYYVVIIYYGISLI